MARRRARGGDVKAVPPVKPPRKDSGGTVVPPPDVKKSGTNRDIGSNWYCCLLFCVKVKIYCP